LDETRELDGIVLRLIREGSTNLYVPDPFYYKKGKTDYLPSTLPVWYNPKMEINRDITILALATFFYENEDDITYIEALAGTGVRGFRVINELKKIFGERLRVVINDINPFACKLMKFNAEVFKYEENLEITCQDANLMLLTYRKKSGNPISAIEIDPYGSPMPFIPSAAQIIRGREGLILASSTDLAPLFGKYPESALRKYAVRLKKTKFDAEIAARALIYSIGKEFTIYSKRFAPLFVLYYDGFIKVIGVVKKGKIPANQFWHNIGWFHYSPKNIFNSSFSRELCANHREEVETLGPVWIGTLCDTSFCEKMLDVLKTLEIDPRNKERLEKFIRWSIAGCDLPLYIDIHEICKMYKLKTKPIDVVLEELKKEQIRATRTFFNYNAIKVDDLQLGVNKVIEILKKGEA